MQTLKKFYFGKQKAKVNTFIGGIGGTINTPALLAVKLGIAENKIKLFKVTGIDVECAILGENTIIRTSFHNDSNVTFFINTEGITTISGQNASQSTFYNCQSLEIVSIYKCTDLVYIPNGPPVIFRFCPKLKHVYLPNLLRSGLNPTRDTSNFLEMQSTPKIYINPFMSTSNTGAEEGDIAYARSQGATIRYVTNFTQPNAITNLSSGTIYNSAVQLNFTPPTSVNGVDFYEVYINGERINSKEIKNSGEFITGLTPSTNYNIRIVAVDMFYNKSEMSNTINVSTNTVDADPYLYINASENQSYETPIVNLFTSLKEQGLYNKIQAFYPFLGTTQAQHKWNAKNPADTNAAFRLQFFGGGTHSNLGYQCNGTNAYANTFLVPSAVQNVNSNGLTVAIGTNNITINSDVVEIGAYVSATSTFALKVKENSTNFARVASFNSDQSSDRVRILGINEARGIFTASKTASNVHKLIRNSSILGTGLGGGSLPNISVWVGALNINNSIYGASNQRIQFTAIHEGLTDSEVESLHTIIDNFETAIGRKTW